MKTLLAVLILSTTAYAGTIGVEWDAVTYTSPVSYQVEGIPASTTLTSATVTVTDCQDATIRVRAKSGDALSEWSAPLAGWPDITPDGILPTETNLSAGEVFIVIEGNNFPADVDVQVGINGEPSWQSTFTEDERTCTSITGTLKLAPNVTSGMELPLTLVSGDQSVLAGVVTVTVEIIPAPTNLRIIR